MPVSRNDHHAQLFATPFSRTRLVTRFGVSVLKVVATIDTPISHHGAARPEVKNSAVLEPARRASTTAGMNETMIDSTTMNQSSGWSSMVRPSARGRYGTWAHGKKTKAGRDATGLQAGDGVRTRDPQLGKLMLYQLSYTRSDCKLNVTPRDPESRPRIFRAAKRYEPYGTLDAAGPRCCDCCLRLVRVWQPGGAPARHREAHARLLPHCRCRRTAPWPAARRRARGPEHYFPPAATRKLFRSASLTAGSPPATLSSFPARIHRSSWSTSEKRWSNESTTNSSGW